MKVKEKGLTGKAAFARKETIGSRRKFNAFRDMAKAKSAKDSPPVEIWLEFMGTKIRVYDEGGGTVKDEDVPHIKGATMKFEGCGGNMQYHEIKVGETIPTLAAVLDHFIESPTRKIHQGSVHPIREWR
jgi:lupus La protein